MIGPLKGIVDLSRAGTQGEFVHHNSVGGVSSSDGCPHCGCTSYFCFLVPTIMEDKWCSHSNPDDAYECANCHAVTTRRDFWSEQFRKTSWAVQHGY